MKETPQRQAYWPEILGFVPSQETEAAINMALVAGGEIRNARGRGMVEYKQGTHNVVTEGDRASSHIIGRELRRIFPDDDFLTEETVKEEQMGQADEILAKERLWVIDELDGSSNAKDGINDVYISIAFAAKGKVAMGVAYNPFTNELYVAEDARPHAIYADLSAKGKVGQRLQVSDHTHLKGSSFETSMSYDDNQSADHNVLCLAMNEMGYSGRPREIGTSVGQLCRVARGQSDLHFHKGLKPWDLASGMLLVQKSGGVFVGMDGRDITFMSPHSVAGNKALVNEFLEFNRRLATDEGFKHDLITAVTNRIKNYRMT